MTAGRRIFPPTRWDALMVAWLTLLGVAQGVMAILVTADLGGRRITGPEAIVAAFAVKWRLLGAALVNGFVVYAGVRGGVLPGIVFYLLFYLAIPVTVIEGTGPLSALSRSAAMVVRRGKRGTAGWSGSLGRILVLSVVSTLVAGLAVLVVPFVASSVAEYASESSRTRTLDLTALLGMPLVTCSIRAAAISLLYPFFSIAHTVLYCDIRLVHEGCDVELLTGVEPQGEGAAGGQEDAA